MSRDDKSRLNVCHCWALEMILCSAVADLECLLSGRYIRQGMVDHCKNVYPAFIRVIPAAQSRFRLPLWYTSKFTPQVDCSRLMAAATIRRPGPIWPDCWNCQPARPSYKNGTSRLEFEKYWRESFSSLRCFLFPRGSSDTVISRYSAR